MEGGGGNLLACRTVSSFSGCPQNVFMKSHVRLQNRERNVRYCEVWKQEITLVRADYYHHIPVPARRHGGDSIVHKRDKGGVYTPKKIILHSPKLLVAVAFVTGWVSISNHICDTKVFCVFRIFQSHYQEMTGQCLSYVMTPSFKILTNGRVVKCK
jgi:hypothetical protein